MDRYTGFAPCPRCFESSGYMSKIVSASWTDPSYEDTDYTRRCEECNGKGFVECQPATFDDLIEEWFEADQALEATLGNLASESSEGRIGDQLIHRIHPTSEQKAHLDAAVAVLRRERVT
jgi:hypothetical protein